MAREARAYRGPLRSLQGEAVPELLGYFRGSFVKEGSNETRFIAAPLFRDAGKPIEDLSGYTAGWSQEARVKFEYKFAQAFMKIHEAGLDHPRFSMMDVVVKNRFGNPLIVGFTHSHRHKCEAKVRHTDIQPCDLQITKEEFGNCPALYPEALAVSLTRYIKLVGTYLVDITTISSPQELFDTVQLKYGKTLQRGVVEAEDAIENFIFAHLYQLKTLYARSPDALGKFRVVFESRMENLRFHGYL
ncbi:hypothetical protein K474DRAFT_1713727 [Panus rudis PR-1116 ss-1]|nr:hypothetical protein K474DRAFT_1713727 [Panus rudis PR-1116 ss-1]